MTTTLALDDDLIEEARRVGGFKTKRQAVNAALKEFIQRRDQLKTIEFFWAIDYDLDYDYKAARGRPQ